MTQPATPLLLERIRASSTPISTPPVLKSGKLVQWLKKPGDHVEQYEALAEIEADGIATELTATTSGIVKALMLREGSTVEGEAILCYIQPTAPSSSLVRTSTTPGQRQPTRAPATSSSSEESPSSFDAPPLPAAESPADNTRRSTWGKAPAPVVEELTLDENLPTRPVRGAGARSKPARGKTTHKTYHLEESQVQRIKRLSLELQLDGDNPLDCNESELIRAAVEMLLDLPRPALHAVMQANREREKAGRYGSGWPRPAKR